MAPWQKPAFTQVWRGTFGGYSVRTPRWRYTMWGLNASHGEELYDYASDVGELRNQAAAPDPSAIKAELRALVERNWAKPYLPPRRQGRTRPAGGAANRNERPATPDR